MSATASAAPTTVLPQPGPSPVRTALRLAADPSRWRPHVDFDPTAGTSTGSGGAFVVLQGVLVEGTALHGVVRGPRHVHRRGVAHAFGPDHVHRVTNEGPDPAVSLHVYAPRLEVQHDYADDDGILRLLATRREGDDW
jgi:hypothetical protein